MQTETVLPRRCNIAIVGAGPAGLSLAAELGRLNVADVHLLERNLTAGGIPSHCNHYPFGLRETGRLLKGPDYAKHLVDKAVLSGASIHTGVSVTALHENGLLDITNAGGKQQIQAGHVVLCTGVRESSRAQRLIGGDRCQGVVSTGALQSLIFQHGITPFQRPVILGTELVSFSAILTCSHAGIKPVAMIEERPHITARSFTGHYARLKRLPIHLSTSDTVIHGNTQVEAVSFTNAAGQRQKISTDGVIVSGQFRPESALLRASHLVVDRATGGASVNQLWRCSDPAYSCVGNGLRPVETAGWCWREARELARCIAEDFDSSVDRTADRMGPTEIEGDQIPIHCTDAALQYCMPQRWLSNGQSRGMSHIQVRVNTAVNGQLQLKSGTHILWSRHLRSQPERRILIPTDTLSQHRLSDPVEISLIQENR